MMKSRWVWVGIAAACGLAVLFLVWRSYPDSWQARGTETLRIGAFSGDVGALAWIAEDQGFFRRVGLDAQMRGFDTGKDSVDALREGRVDVATASEFVVADRSFSEPDLRVLGSVCRYWNKGLIARRDRGIDTPADLKGKRIGVTVTSTAEQTLVVFLAMHGLSTADVVVVDLSPRQLIDGIGSGSIDAAMTWQPHVDTIERQLGANAVGLMKSGSDAYLVALTREDLLAAKDEAFRRYLRALLLAEDWVRADPGRARKWLATRFSLADAYVDKLWPNMSLAVTLPQEILEVMDGEARWLATKKRVGALPNYGRSMAPAPLAAVRPAAVTVFARLQ